MHSWPTALCKNRSDLSAFRLGDNCTLILVAGPVKRRFQKWTCAGLWSRVFANLNYVQLTRIQSGVVRSNYRWSLEMHFNPKGELTYFEVPTCDQIIKRDISVPGLNSSQIRGEINCSYFQGTIPLPAPSTTTTNLLFNEAFDSSDDTLLVNLSWLIENCKSIHVFTII